jgi:two-component system, NtrC family, sensor kinase
MKLELLICVIVLSLNVGNTANVKNPQSTYQVKMDSINHLLENYPKEDEEKVKLMNQYARLCFYNREFQEGLIVTLAARELSVELNFPEGMLMYYLTLSSFHTDGEMRRYYRKKAQWLTRQLDDQMEKYDIYTEIPGYSLGEEYLSLIDQFNISYDHFEKLGEIEMQANILMGISYFNYQLGNMEEANAINEKVKLFFTEIDEIYPVFLLSIYKMNNLIESGKITEAREIEFELIDLVARRENDNVLGLIASTMATNYREKGRWVLAIEYYIKSLEVFSGEDDLELLARIQFMLGISYENLNMNSKAADSYAKSIAALKELNDTTNLYNAYSTIVFPLIALKKYDQARKYMVLALHDTITENSLYFKARYNDAEAQILRDQGKYAEAIPLFNKAFHQFDQLEYNRWAPPFMKLYLAECYLKIGDYDMALKEGLKCLEMENALNSDNTIVKKKISFLLSEIYEQMRDLKMAYQYLKMHQIIRAESDKLDEANRIADAEVRSILDKSQKEIDELEREKLKREQESKIQRLWIFSIAGALISALILSIILYRNNHNKQKANTLLKEQKEEIESTLEKLESTQSQLIHSEKMASLGELTAGIAHEIQNPLNFVNNFSDVSEELVTELKEELDKGEVDEAKLISDDVIQNLKKVKHHGQRASDIVKGMLQHSRSSNGQKEPTDINALADEYLRLAYHGLRAKDKSFNAEFKTELDPELPKIRVVPQDIGRVLLNLINNAFYAVAQRSKLEAGSDDFKPLVTVTTKGIPLPRDGFKEIQISVKDNGEGIPKQVRDKIFQPFFTTKPAGQGTGLGLSLSYDIVTKGHGGELKLTSRDYEGTSFLVILPV